MGKIKWTEEQSKVIYTRNCNLLVAAAAGSGKTAVLVQRIINMIMDEENPVDIDKLLVVTFTNAAASEMRERIGDALSKEIGERGNSIRLQRQLTLLNKASITTIHSFCLNVIKNNFHKVDVDPGFRVADQTEVVLLKNETLEELFEHKYENIKGENLEEKCTGEEFLNLVETYCSNKDDSALLELVLRIHSFSNTAPNPRAWLIEQSEEFNMDKFTNIEDTKWVKILKNNINMELEGQYEQYKDVYNLVCNIEELNAYEPVIREELSIINDLMQALKSSFENFLQELSTVKFGRLPSVRKIENKDAKDKVQKIRNSIKKSLDELSKNYSSITEEDIKSSYIKIYPIIKNLVELVIQFDSLYKLKKKEKGIIDFNDFEHFCLEILIEKDEEGNWIKNEEGIYIPSDTAIELRDKYDEILIDEYQDSNLVQELILNLVSKISEGSPNIFMVGDIKQSIYRFRQAKPELFLSKYNSYSEVNEDSLYKKILLFKNFRSREEVLDGVNFIFKSIMSERVGELEYNEKEALNLGANYENYIEGAELGGDIELHILEKNSDTEKENELDKIGDNFSDELEELDEPTDIAYEAKITANRIKEFIENKEKPFMVLDKETKEYRRVMYKDIVILLRSTVNWSEQFIEEFKKYNIPVYADTSTGYFETIEIKTMLSLLQIIDNPIQDIPLLAVMRSPIGGFSSEDFVYIRENNNNISFYEACINYIEEEETELKVKLKEFYTKINHWRERSLYTPIDQFIWYLYMETGYYGFVGALKGGMQKQANLKVLFQRAREYENTSYSGLFNFINFINKLKKNSGDMGSAKILGENEDVVRIMSIHKSKGLEFPIVFLCGIGKQFNLKDLSSNLLLHHELGFGPDLIDFERRISYPLPVKRAIREKIAVETLSEEMRILYVALTRAKEKLILIGGVRDITNFIKKSYENAQDNRIKVPEFITIKGRSYLDWITMALVKHREVAKDLEKELYRFNKEEICIENTIDDKSKWSIRIWDKSDMEEVLQGEEQDRGECVKRLLEGYLKEDDENSYDDFVENRLSYKYPYIKASELPTVLSVSELKRRFNTMEVENSGSLIKPHLKQRPSFMEGKSKLTGAERGTAFHAVMEYLDFTKISSIDEIENQIFNLYAREFITEEESKAVNPNKILKFFNTELGKRIIKAFPKVYREVEFHIPLKSTEVFKDLDVELYKGEEILLQGIIDCYFEENDEIILLDYKTDFILEGEEEILKERYKSQLQYYSKAIAEITGKEVSEKYLYLFTLDKCVRIN